MSWITASLKDFACTVFDGPHATPKDSESGHSFLGIKNVSENGSLDLSDPKFISDEEFPKWTRRVKPKKNDVVFSYEATLHRYAIIPEGFDGCLGRRMGLVRVDEGKLVPRYLLYYFLSPLWRAYADTKVIIGATVNRLPIKDFPDFQISAPDLHHQQRIVEILASYDDLIENNRRRIQLLEESARLLYQEWFVHLRFPGHEQVKTIDGVPEGWDKTTADKVMDVLSGGTPKTKVTEFWDGEIPFFTPKDAKGLFTYNTEKTITDLGLSKCNGRLYPKYTVFITARGTVGKLSFAQRPMAMNQSCYALVTKGEISQEFLYSSLKASIEQFKARASGAVFDAIVVDTFKNIPFLVPSSSLRDEFTEQVKDVFSQIDNLSIQNMKLAQARDLLLPKLMSGELTV
ncbi:putative type I restriction-modification system specificity subunit [Teredinibacter turnerae T7901]|uniref:Type I restriction-modification system specificity subunit n=1 Tax=Teredinibacter turnerae (strain ATCC 39867 / T7901) TaxID=377629 RepID=C5BTJ5_TERTT|nr:restriction endonuclease subunit S [Teredinibacter turnerae]ACR11943.1 putative type I restriction-modification system specificity subunit [Teredinibacter turnerae T7901]